jgi:hypothetical protein
MSTPNFNTDLKLPNKYNRGMDNKYVDGVSIPLSVGLYTIDNGILKYLQTKINPVVNQDGKQIKVPVIYGNPERWKSAQQDGGIRDKNGKIMLPIIMLRRTTMKKNSINSPINKHQTYAFKSGWNSRNIYDKFTVLNRITPSETYHVSIVPDYYDISYDVMIWTEYMEQMNLLVENITFESDEYWGQDNNYKFISRINQIKQTTDLPETKDRLVRSEFSIDIKAYILPEYALNKQGNRSKSVNLQYSPKKIVFDTEIVTRTNK